MRVLEDLDAGGGRRAGALHPGVAALRQEAA
jgi:hypothetical protein